MNEGPHTFILKFHELVHARARVHDLETINTSVLHTVFLQKISFDFDMKNVDTRVKFPFLLRRFTRARVHSSVPKINKLVIFNWNA